MTDVRDDERHVGGHRAGAPGGADDDGLAAELAAQAGRRWWNTWTIYLGALVLVLGGFAGGILAERSYGTSTAGNLASGRSGQSVGGATGGRQQGGGMPSGMPDGSQRSASSTSATTGTVKLVDGTTLYVETADGTVVTIRTTDDTAVRIGKEAALKDLKAGDPVTVQGADSAGAVTASTITSNPR